MGLYNHAYDGLSTAGQYRNLAKAGDIIATPAANVLTRTLTVTPGSELSGYLGLTCHYKNITLCAGYNLYARDTEEVVLEKSNDWFNNEYAKPVDAYAFNTTGAIVVGKAGHTSGGAIQRENETTYTTASDGSTRDAFSNAAQYFVSTAACASPSDVTHKVGGSVEFTFSKICPSIQYQWWR